MERPLSGTHWECAYTSLGGIKVFNFPKLGCLQYRSSWKLKINSSNNTLKSAIDHKEMLFKNKKAWKRSKNTINLKKFETVLEIFCQNASTSIFKWINLWALALWILRQPCSWLPLSYACQPHPAKSSRWAEAIFISHFRVLETEKQAGAELSQAKLSLSLGWISDFV